jgi:hypothetical protein
MENLQEFCPLGIQFPTVEYICISTNVLNILSEMNVIKEWNTLRVIPAPR